MKESTVQAAASCFRKCFRKNLGDKVRKMSVCSHLHSILQVTAFSLYHITKRDRDFLSPGYAIKGLTAPPLPEPGDTEQEPCIYFSGYQTEDGARLLPVVPSARKGGNGQKLEHRGSF